MIYINQATDISVIYRESDMESVVAEAMETDAPHLDHAKRSMEEEPANAKRVRHERPRALRVGVKGESHYYGSRKWLSFATNTVEQVVAALLRVSLLIGFVAKDIGLVPDPGDLCCYYPGFIDMDADLDPVQQGRIPLFDGENLHKYKDKKSVKRALKKRVREEEWALQDIVDHCSWLKEVMQQALDLVSALQQDDRVSDVHMWFTGGKGFRVVWYDGGLWRALPWKASHQGLYIKEHVLLPYLLALQHGTLNSSKLDKYIDANVYDFDKGVKPDLHLHPDTKFPPILVNDQPGRYSLLAEEVHEDLRRVIGGFWKHVVESAPLDRIHDLPRWNRAMDPPHSSRQRSVDPPNPDANPQVAPLEQETKAFYCATALDALEEKFPGSTQQDSKIIGVDLQKSTVTIRAPGSYHACRVLKQVTGARAHSSEHPWFIVHLFEGYIAAHCHDKDKCMPWIEAHGPITTLISYKIHQRFLGHFAPRHKLWPRVQEIVQRLEVMAETEARLDRKKVVRFHALEILKRLGREVLDHQCGKSTSELQNVMDAITMHPRMPSELLRECLDEASRQAWISWTPGWTQLDIQTPNRELCALADAKGLTLENAQEIMHRYWSQLEQLTARSLEQHHVCVGDEVYKCDGSTLKWKSVKGLRSYLPTVTRYSLGKLVEEGDTWYKLTSRKVPLLDIWRNNPYRQCYNTIGMDPTGRSDLENIETYLHAQRTASKRSVEVPCALDSLNTFTGLGFTITATEKAVREHAQDVLKELGVFLGMLAAAFSNNPDATGKMYDSSVFFYVLRLLAKATQCLGIKLRKFIILCEKHGGAGKGLFQTLLLTVFGRGHTLMEQGNGGLDSSFLARWMKALIGIIDEFFVNSTADAAALRNMVSEETTNAETKNVEKGMGTESYLSLGIASTNLPLFEQTHGKRRFVNLNVQPVFRNAYAFWDHRAVGFGKNREQAINKKALLPMGFLWMLRHMLLPPHWNPDDMPVGVQQTTPTGVVALFWKALLDAGKMDYTYSARSSMGEITEEQRTLELEGENDPLNFQHVHGAYGSWCDEHQLHKAKRLAKETFAKESMEQVFGYESRAHWLTNMGRQRPRLYMVEGAEFGSLQDMRMRAAEHGLAELPEPTYVPIPTTPELLAMCMAWEVTDEDEGDGGTAESALRCVTLEWVRVVQEWRRRGWTVPAAMLVKEMEKVLALPEDQQQRFLEEEAAKTLIQRWENGVQVGASRVMHRHMAVDDLFSDEDDEL